MQHQSKIRLLVLFTGDVAALYLSLFAALFIRYGDDAYRGFTETHATPFTVIFGIWVVVFYVAGLYDLRRLRNGIDFIKTLWLALFTNGLLTITLFYLIPTFGIAPRRNLFLFIIIFAVIETLWRRFFNSHIGSSEPPNKVLLIGNGPTAEEVVRAVNLNPQLGYEIKAWLKEDSANTRKANLHALVKEHGINLIVIPRHLKKDTRLTGALYGLLSHGVEARDLPNFYEVVFRKIPLADLEEAWFLENLVGQQKFYDQLKRALEFVIAFFLFIALLPLEILIALGVKIASPGPAVYKQERVGRGGRSFMLYKFRTMDMNAEKNGAQWADPNDARATPFGRFLRYTHLDELPQLINIIKNELSFVGPRPERPEFVKLLEEKIPYYDIRHLVKPGVTGWAQINYRYGASVEDAYEKLQHDIYYLKNRSVVLDISIFLKTLKSFFVNQT
ncbi:sugar transferase [Candidatus Parcubacteria bacterium]|nr:MAG: sugar transferase [Candidatus Parcubacteria bacterium]